MMTTVDLQEAVEVRFRRWDGNDDLPLPTYATEGSAAFDIRAAVSRDQVINPGARALIETGFAVAVPEGYEMQIRPRSGLARVHGITVLNAPATIDSDFRGQVCACLINHGSEPFIVRRGDRIAQALVAPVRHVKIVEADELDETVRGSGGFGSTGVA